MISKKYSKPRQGTVLRCPLFTHKFVHYHSVFAMFATIFRYNGSLSYLIRGSMWYAKWKRKHKTSMQYIKGRFNRINWLARSMLIWDGECFHLALPLHTNLCNIILLILVCKMMTIPFNWTLKFHVVEISEIFVHGILLLSIMHIYINTHTHNMLLNSTNSILCIVGLLA